MSAAVELQIEKREAFGKGAARALRRKGVVPAILYAKGKDNICVSVAEKDITREYHKGGFYSKIVTLVLGDKKFRALPRELQLHPVSDRIEHADFLLVDDSDYIEVFVPVRFLNVERCIGIKRGGSLNVVRHSIELLCKPDNIPTAIEIDIKATNIGESIHISHVELPEGVKPTVERDFTIATITGRASKDEAAREGAEGEEGSEEGASSE